MSVTPEQLEQYFPFQLLARNVLEEAARSAELISIAPSKMLFKRDDPRDDCWWLLSGAIDLVDANFETVELNASDSTNNFCLDENDRYQRTAIATRDSQFIRMKQDVLDLLVTVDQASDTETSDDDWMTRLLSSRLFEFIPPANIQALFQNFSAINYQKGDQVVTEGESGDYFYVIKQGSAKIEKVSNGETLHLKTIGPGDCFGEDALISNKKRNATITMQSSGVLMRLGKTEFNQLLVKPASEYVTLDEVRSVIEGGEQKISLIDVRHPSEIDVEIVEGARNIPLQLLRNRFDELDRETVYVVATPGRRAELGALVLTQAGFDSYILQHE